MENASKALLISGGILIAMLVISIGVYLFANYSDVGSSYEQTMEATEGKDIRGEFSETFNNVTTTAQSKDETLEYDVAYLNVVNGILAAIGDVQGETTTEESTETNSIE